MFIAAADWEKMKNKNSETENVDHNWIRLDACEQQQQLSAKSAESFSLCK